MFGIFRKHTHDHHSIIREIHGVADLLSCDLREMESRIMAKITDITELLARIDAATDAIAKKLKDAADALAAGGLTAAEEEGVIASLRTEADKLEGLAKNPEDPVPAEIAEPGETAPTGAVIDASPAPPAEPTPEPPASPTDK